MVMTLTLREIREQAGIAISDKKGIPLTEALRELPSIENYVQTVSEKAGKLGVTSAREEQRDRRDDDGPPDRHDDLSCK